MILMMKESAAARVLPARPQMTPDGRRAAFETANFHRGPRHFRDHGRRRIRVTVAAHEHVEGRVVAFGPGVHGDVGLRQQDDAGHAAAAAEGVHVRGHHLRASRRRGAPHQRLERGGIEVGSRPRALDQEVASRSLWRH